MKTALALRPHHAPRGDFDAYLDIAAYADKAGIGSLEFGDHIIMGSPDRYPYGRWPHAQDTPWFDPLTVLSAVAAVTSRLRLGTGVLLAALRSPAVLAKTVATLDVISAGRVDLGVGVGWQREEFQAVGLPWAGRNARLDEVVRVCRALWGDQPVTAEGAGATLTDVFAYPRPVQSRIPIVYGVKMSERNAARIAQHGDGWCPLELTPDELAAGVRQLRDAFEACGRDPSTVIVRMDLPSVVLPDGTLDIKQAFSSIDEYRDAGLTTPVVGQPSRFQRFDDATDLIDNIVDITR